MSAASSDYISMGHDKLIRILQDVNAEAMDAKKTTGIGKKVTKVGLSRQTTTTFTLGASSRLMSPKRQGVYLTLF